MINPQINELNLRNDFIIDSDFGTDPFAIAPWGVLTSHVTAGICFKLTTSSKAPGYSAPAFYK